MSCAFDILPITEGHWQQVRDLRLEMLADTPRAYLERLETALEFSEDDWRSRARRSASVGSCGLAAVERDTARWVGAMHGAVFPDGRAFLLGVYVAPALRGRTLGVADALLDGVERWARAVGQRALYLHVHEDNARAISFYRRRGYESTGAREPYPLEEGEYEIEMSVALVA